MKREAALNELHALKVSTAKGESKAVIPLLFLL